MANYLYFSKTGDGQRNLALDEWFIDHLDERDFLLYFYVNENAVIIGKNQNPWKECALDKMTADGVQLVRRISGGGAVYHDAGNLNFSFIAGHRYDKEKQNRIVIEAVRSLGIDCGFSGRNDILTRDGRKFSGAAYCSRGKLHQHHGTLLINSDLTRLSGYLTVDVRKLRAKGVDSVRARVTNLCEYQPDLTVERVRDAVIASAKTLCGDFLPVDFPEGNNIAQYEKKHKSEEWLYGKTPPFDAEIDCRLSFGGVDMLLSFSGGRIAKVKTYTDANDEQLPELLSATLCGLPYEKDAVVNALESAGDERLRELAGYLRTNGL